MFAPHCVVLQKAGNHMEHTLLASYVSLVIGYLIMDSPAHQRIVRRLLRNGRFTEMVLVLEKYYTFMNLTASVSRVGILYWIVCSMFEFQLTGDKSNSHPTVRVVRSGAHQTDQNDYGVLQEL